MMSLDEFYNVFIDRLDSIEGILAMKLRRKGDKDCHMITIYFDNTKKELLKIEMTDSGDNDNKKIHISTNHRTNEYGFETFTIADQKIKYVHFKAMIALEKLILSKMYEYEYDLLYQHVTDPDFFYYSDRRRAEYIKELESLVKVNQRNSFIEDVLKEKES